MSERLVTIAVIGAGGRGCTYSRYATHFPEELKVVAVADVDDFRLNSLADLHGVPAERRFRSWQEFAAQPKMCDAVMVCTQDRMHEEVVVACAALGYHILLEKPMAPTLEACEHIVKAVKEAGVMCAVCHVLRYTKYTQALRQILDSGEIGEVVNIQHLEPVGLWHMAHSFVRGNWRNTAESSFMLLAKCCHDVDWLRSIMGKPCKAVSSFGSRHHFRKEQQPAGAADRCIDCPREIESHCPVSAYKIYFRDFFEKGRRGWPIDVLTQHSTREELAEALRNGPYGRCAYACDNDVVDNQVVNMEFEGGGCASMIMSAFTPTNSGRRTTIMGTRGAIVTTDSTVLTITHFLDGSRRVVDTNVANDGGILTGHGGGDFGLMAAFVKALRNEDPSLLPTSVDESLETHKMAFLAEKARLTGTVQYL